MKHFLSLNALTVDEIEQILDVGHQMKQQLAQGILEPCAQGKTLAMIFEKDSMRTRISFEVAMTQMAGHAIFIVSQDLKMGLRESVEDVARVMSRYVDIIMIRTFAQQTLERFAEYASVPVINGLTDACHPCQIMADMLTLQERFDDLENVRIAFVGDGNNIARSLAIVCAKMGIPFVCASPAGYELKTDELQNLTGETSSCVKLTADPAEAVSVSNVVYTDVWASMGQEDEAEQRRSVFKPYQVNSALMAQAPEDAVVMHCLPAHRGDEITDDVIDSDQSIVFDQAENRLHMHKAIIRFLLEHRAEGAR